MLQVPVTLQGKCQGKCQFKSSQVIEKYDRKVCILWYEIEWLGGRTCRWGLVRVMIGSSQHRTHTFEIHIYMIV